ncbi:MAG: hypothetical protein HYY06_32085 [Deltaproteobacteria bacterium]|nr:hypothetical protein [Deltaproteobacteria bacterium]
MRGVLLLVALALAIGWVVRTILTELRAIERRGAGRKAADQAWKERTRQALVEPGGSPEDPVPITSPSVVEVEALTRRCTKCEGVMRLAQHSAETIEGERLRVAHLVCDFCSATREVYFRLVSR